MKNYFIKAVMLIGALVIGQSVVAQTTYIAGCRVKCNHRGHVIVPSTKEILKKQEIVIEMDRSFYNCLVESVTIPNSVKKINESFEKCIFLKDVKFPSNLQKLSNSFIECDYLATIILPDNLTEINKCFYKCISLKTIHLPKNLKIMNSCFKSCGNMLPPITIPGSIEQFSDCFHYGFISSITFEGTFKALKEIDKSFRSFTVESDITIPEGVEKIDHSFYVFRAKKVTLPRSIVKMNDSFKYCGFEGLVLQNPIPPEVEACFEYDTYHGCTLYVPKGSLNAYKTAEGWKNFIKIEEL